MRLNDSRPSSPIGGVAEVILKWYCQNSISNSALTYLAEITRNFRINDRIHITRKKPPLLKLLFTPYPKVELGVTILRGCISYHYNSGDLRYQNKLSCLTCLTLNQWHNLLVYWVCDLQSNASRKRPWGLNLSIRSIFSESHLCLSSWHFCLTYFKITKIRIMNQNKF